MGAFEENEGYSGHEFGDEVSGYTMPNMSSKVVRFSKAQLLSIARLPAANVKPTALSPLIDKDCKESQHLIRMIGIRPPVNEDVTDGREKQRERRNDRRGDREGSHGEEELPAQHADAAAQMSSSSAPKSRGQAPAMPGLVLPDAGEKSSLEAAAFEEWEQRALEQAAALAGGKGAAASSARQAAGAAGAQASASGGSAQSFLSAQNAAAGQAQSLSQQAHAMQAAAYMQLSMNAAAAAAARNGYPGGMPPPWGYNPYLFPPYGNPYAGGYPNSLDYSMGAQALQGKAAVDGAGAATAAPAAGFGRGGAKAAAKAKAVAPPAAVQAGHPGSSAPKAPLHEAKPPAVAVEAPLKAAPSQSREAVAEGKQQEEDEAGCSQS